MEKFDAIWGLEESFARFERAAAKGHEEAIWITSVVKDVEMEWNALKEALVKTEKPLGWFLAGRFSEWQSFDFYKKSAEGGCSWGQLWYAWYFEAAVYVEKDDNRSLEWREKSVSQNNPQAMYSLGNWFYEEGDDKEKAVSYYRGATELGWTGSMDSLARMLQSGDGCAKDLRQAAIWGGKGNAQVFWKVLSDMQQALQSRTMENLGGDFDQLCYTLGWGLFWYMYENQNWDQQRDENRVFGERCLDYYCCCVELQQKSILTFLLCWNRTTGVKGPGQIIVQMVWEQREDNLVQTFEERAGEELETNRIKK
jgi:hypothetical protein